MTATKIMRPTPQLFRNWTVFVAAPYQPRTACMALAAIFLFILSSSALALSVDYKFEVNAYYNPNYEGVAGYCTSGVSGSACSISYSNYNPFNPYPDYVIDQWNHIDVAAIAIDGQVHAFASADASFRVLNGDALFSAYLSSSGGEIVHYCVSTDDFGGETCYTASAHADARIGEIVIKDFIIADIEESLDGQAAYARVSIAADGIGTGSSYGELRLSAGGETGFASFGHLNYYSEFAYTIDSSIDLIVPLREAGDFSRSIAIPFELTIDLRSDTAGGAGYIDLSHSIDLNVTSVDGITFRSASGDLDGLLAGPRVSVPEPPTVALLIAGLFASSAWARSRRQQGGRGISGSS
jgi:hypothetical protein